MQARRPWRQRLDKHLSALGLAVSMVLLTWVAYDTTAELIAMPLGGMSPVFGFPVRLLDPFRIANQYGLFAVMTRGRYEIKIQGSDDGNQWVASPFRYKPQALNEPPGIYAPYQPRFDWNLWFASLGDWQQNDIVPLTEESWSERSRCAGVVQEQSVSRDPAAVCARGAVAVLVYNGGRGAADGQLVAAPPDRGSAPELTITPNGHFAVVESPPVLPPHG